MIYDANSSYYFLCIKNINLLQIKLQKINCTMYRKMKRSIYNIDYIFNSRIWNLESGNWNQKSKILHLNIYDLMYDENVKSF